MKQSDTKRILELLTQLTEAVGVPPPGPPPGAPKASLSDRVDGLSDRVDGLSDRVDGLTDRVDGLTDRVDGLTDCVGKLDDRVSEVQLGLATLAVTTKQRFDSVDVQFTGVRGAIESTRVQLVDLVGSVHSELTGRIIDLEVPGPGGRGGSPSGSGGVPMAS